MGSQPIVMKNISRTAAAKASKRKPWFRGKYAASAPKPIAKGSKKAPKYYSAEDKKVKLNNSHQNTKQTKLKASLVPGAVVILLAGPFKVNGIPLRRVPQSYVIGTSTVVDFKTDASGVTDDLFKKPKSAKKKSADGPFEEKAEKAPLDAAFKALQDKVDGPVAAAVNGDAMLKGYLKSKFGLSRAEYPHEMAF